MDIILTTNSPGEVSAWVRPMVKQLKKEWPDSKITVFIPPCTFASGREVGVVESFDEVDQVFGPGEYIRYAILKRKPRGFQPSKKGFVLFLGGDLGHATLLGKRLSFPVYAYSERDAGHADKIRAFFVPSKKVLDRLIKKGVDEKKVRVVGDLMLDAVHPELSKDEVRSQLGIGLDDRVLNIFLGSRNHELVETVPLFLSGLTLLKEDNLKKIITLAPFITLANFEKLLKRMCASECQVKNYEIHNIDIKGAYKLQLDDHEFILYQDNSYNTMQLSDVALSLPGTNNVELAAMGVPTLVVLPLNRPELIPLPGVIGLIGQIPLLGAFIKRKIVIPKLLPKFPFISPVNRVAGEKIFPELIGVLTSEMITNRIKKIFDQEISQIKDKLCAEESFKKEEGRKTDYFRDLR